MARGSLSQAEAASRLAVHEQTLGKYERDRRQPDAEFLASLRSEFGISLDWLVTGQGPMRPTESPSEAPVDEQILSETLRLVEEWLAAHGRTMTPARKAEVVASIYTMLSEDAATGQSSVDERVVAHVLKIVV